MREIGLTAMVAQIKQRSRVWGIRVGKRETMGFLVERNEEGRGD